MSLHPLIKGQRIRCEDHQRGQPTRWENVHLHKTFEDGDWKGVEVCIHRDTKRGLTIKSGRRKLSEKEEHIITREIVKALGDRHLLEQFLEDAIKELNRVAKGVATHEEIQEIRNDVARMAKGYFDLDPVIIAEILGFRNNRLSYFLSVHRDTADQKLYAFRLSIASLSVGSYSSPWRVLVHLGQPRE